MGLKMVDKTSIIYFVVSFDGLITRSYYSEGE